ncbi:MAG: homoserine kinase [Candidatus Sericytochromatia bacterium]|nr:homoserine kinase [Candidatus Sericytochromatia bacterium]
MRLRVPATSANLGPGFDVLGLALPLENHITLAPADRTTFVHTGPHAHGLPDDATHLSGVAARRLATELGRELPPWRWEIEVAIPPARGLGSSSAAIVAGLVAANEAFDRPLDRLGLLRLASELEGHPDNAAPALFGGVTAAHAAGEALWCLPLADRVPATLVAAVPDFSLSTAEARAALPPTVSRADAIANVAAVTALTTVMLHQDVSWWAAGLGDRLHQPWRLPLVRGATDVLAAARAAGAWGAVLSGAGPTLLAFVPPARAEAVAEAMGEAWRRHGVRPTVMPFPHLAAGAGLLPP